MKDITNIEAERHVLTSAERLEAFCEACASTFMARVRHQERAAEFESGTLPHHAMREASIALRELDVAAYDAEAMMIARAMSLHEDGTFDRCIEVLQAETVGRP